MFYAYVRPHATVTHASPWLHLIARIEKTSGTKADGTYKREMLERTLLVRTEDVCHFIGDVENEELSILYMKDGRSYSLAHPAEELAEMFGFYFDEDEDEPAEPAPMAQATDALEPFRALGRYWNR